jgi:hypothetical protein
MQQHFTSKNMKKQNLLENLLAVVAWLMARYRYTFWQSM